MILTVTAIQFQLAPEEPVKDKRVKVVEEFLAGLRKGQEVMLTAEPENPVDAQAIAAYIDFKRIGYLSKENTETAYPLLDEDGLCKATIDHHDNHLTLFVDVACDHRKATPFGQRKRTLPESPFGMSFRLGFTELESRQQLIMKCLAKLEVSKENLPEILKLTRQFCSTMCLSVCREDALWIGSIDKMLDKICLSRDELGLEAEEAAEFARLYNNVHEAAGDLHCTGEHMPEQIFTEHLDRIRSNKRITEFFYRQYCDMFLDGKDFSKADQELVKAERERLLGWLKSMSWSELRNPDNLRMMGYRVNYLRLSRLELYDLYSVLLLIERLNPSSQKAPVEIFWKRVAEARKTYFTSKRLWFVPCKCLMWMRAVEEDDFRTAVRMIQEHFPDLKLDHKDLSRLNIYSFSKPLEEWNENNSPFKEGNGKVYMKYLDLAHFLMQK